MRKANLVLLLGLLLAGSAFGYPRRVLIEEFTSDT